MQVAVALLGKCLATSLTVVWPRLCVRPSMMNSTRLDGELALAHHASEAELEPTSLDVHDIAALQVFHQKLDVGSVFVATAPFTITCINLMFCWVRRSLGLVFVIYEEFSCFLLSLKSLLRCFELAFVFILNCNVCSLSIKNI